jgi:hypothetical protein
MRLRSVQAADTPAGEGPAGFPSKLPAHAEDGHANTFPAEGAPSLLQGHFSAEFFPADTAGLAGQNELSKPGAEIASCTDEDLAALIDAALRERVRRLEPLNEKLGWNPEETCFHLIAYRENAWTQRLKETGREHEWINPEREEAWIRLDV